MVLFLALLLFFFVSYLDIGFARARALIATLLCQLFYRDIGPNCPWRAWVWAEEAAAQASAGGARPTMFPH